MKKGITVRMEQNEYELLVAKARGYRSLQQYIHDKLFEENTSFIEDIQGKKEICSYFDIMRVELVKQEKLLRDSIPDIAFTIEERKKLESLLNTMIFQRKQIEDTLNKKLYREYIDVKETTNQEVESDADH